MSWRPEGIYQCNGCGQTYAEYVNGCPKHASQPRKVVLVVPEYEVAEALRRAAE